MVKKPNKKKEPKHTSTVPADVRHYIDVVRAQSNKDMEKYIVRLRKESDEDLTRYMGSLIEHTDDRIAGISEEFVDFRRTLNSHTEMIVDLAEDVAVIKEDVKSMRDILENKVDRKEFIVLERRVSAVEVQ